MHGVEVDMRIFRSIGVIAVIAALAAPSVALQAQQGRARGHAQVYIQPAYDEGYRQGLITGEDHGRRGETFNFSVALAYQRGDIGYRAQFGTRDQYRGDFRVGFEQGYREGYTRHAVVGRPGYYDGGHGWFEIAINNGYRDGYDQGLNDGRYRHRNDPFAESWYRIGDRGYSSRYGSRDAYRNQYRDGFRRGYERGYDDGWRR
jgi:flagellar biosynthesis/type III secretory pathway protein FliH